MRDDLPTGTVTLLLTDIEGSTRMLHRLGDQYGPVLAAHREILRSAFTKHGGVEVDTQGDAFFVAFPTAIGCIRAAADSQRGLAEADWPNGNAVKVRMGMHTGEPTRSDEGYVGMDVHAAARVCSAGHGGQILVSEATTALVRDELAAHELTLRDLGEHKLKDIEGGQHLFQVVIPGLQSDFSPLRSLTTRPNNLPTPPTPFVGREQEVVSVRDLLLRDEVRVATLTGPGGTGKTRLALRVASELLHAFADGAFFVPLASLHDASLVVPAVAQALGVREGRGLPLIENLKRYLREKELLLVLDNFEHVRQAARDIAELLTQSPRVKVLATSREVLRLSAEHDVPVPPMATPSAGELPPLAELERYDSVRLFCARAAAAQPDFGLSEETAQPVGQICRRLDGLPLAIELAAARVRTMRPDALLEALESRLTVLTNGAIDLPERQQTLRDTIAWSFDLLEPAEQSLYRRLAVFVGGWDAEAAAAVSAPDEIDFSEGIQSLVDKSLIRAESLGEGGPNKVLSSAEAPPRLTMLETIREFGLEQLTSSAEETGVRDRHLDWFVGFADKAEPELRGPEQGVWLGRLDQEFGNLRGALEHALQGPRERADRGLSLCSALWLFWYERGHLSEGRRWLELALSTADVASTPVRARALTGAAELGRHLGEYAVADELGAEALAIYRELEDKSGTAQALRALGVIAQFQGESERASEFLAESLMLSRELGDTERIAHALRDLGSGAMIRGDHDRARELYEEGLVESRKLGDESSIATLLLNLGEIAKLQEDTDRARVLYSESLESFRDLEFKAAIAYCLEAIAGLDAILGRSELAASLFGAAEKLREVIDVPVEPHNLDQYQADVMAARDRMDEDDFDASWDAGRALPLEGAIKTALERDEPDA